jgi:hypothetical protein
MIDRLDAILSAMLEVVRAAQAIRLDAGVNRKATMGDLYYALHELDKALESK